MPLLVARFVLGYSRAIPRLAETAFPHQRQTISSFTRLYYSTFQSHSISSVKTAVQANVPRQVACPEFFKTTTSCTGSLLALAVGLRVSFDPSVLSFRKVHCEARSLVVRESVTPAKVLAKIEQPRESLSSAIWELVKPDLFLLACIVLTAVAAAVVYLQTPVVTGELINVLQLSFTSGALSIQDLNGPAIRLLALLSAQGFFTFAHITLVSLFGEKVAVRLRRDLFSAMVRQDMSFFDDHKSGELVGRLTSDVADFKHTFKQVVTQGLKSITQTVGSAIHLFRISAPLTLTMLATMPILYVLLNVYGAYLRKLSKIGKSLDSVASGLAGEVLSNMKTVRAFASEEREMEHYGAACQEVAEANEYMGFHIGIFQGLTNVSIGCMVLTVLYYGGSLVVRNEMTCGELMTYMLSTQTAQQSLVSLGVLFSQTIKAAASASRVFEFIHLAPNVPLHGGLMLEHVGGDLEFTQVVFRYPTRLDQPVLDRFDLVVPQGTTVALCGPSVASLIERFYEPLEGSIRLDGQELRTLDPSWLRHNVGFINQEPVLFATSIAENIRYGRPEATMEEVKEAARKANAAYFIEGFTDGYDTMVGERGASLSGGQKQRIAIARAILKDPKILILDEATSALDTHSEKMVQEALDLLMKGRTVVVIAHRLSTIRSADKIVVMGRVPGNVLEQGTHDELMANQSAYFRLHSQLSHANPIL
ncbi:hypothetical protein PHYBLDRAFT_149758 [Phycomyces blakesleeanus NRRL 1555(-)]|uniref:Mitochondrial potassium channel ATP-binding subunit n=1 Tax=Phycomyces blakesleeanus (strain ATCC 8743b / DSM 1359 / FGSC 10004 / NBRC 33097 / NRRL 1555) TaxID=763407 RepID=A0A163D7P0_PHYB8|nr:hypothetical protein PHYBLDRAFT_149758 [Phycomyces blakesleeanus NRRL 1555(-)]OAD69360.1 hypothetical protein PHYBLDRAFT_149758 [Phycomyces blakesleeanus NRRL 1555(-)]|eukprot:XP_018287400.1 hypothetical protein PHYBLDRAFT_149758 [Phycomyces blakesleeanus NRRL 1555(-)]